MAHAVSAFYVRSNRMSLVAAFLAVALHAAMALAAWSLAPLHNRDLEDNAVDVTMEEPASPQETPAPEEAVKPPPPPSPPPLSPAPAEQAALSPPPPPPPPAAAPQPQPEPQLPIVPREPLGLPPEPPEAPPTVEPPKPVAQAPELKPDPESEPKREPQAQSTPPEPALEPTPEPQQQAAVVPLPAPTPPPEPKQQAAVAPPPAPALPVPEPALESAIPPVEAPPAPLTMRDFAKVLPPPPRPAPAPAPQRPAPQHQAPPALQHSPLSTGPSRPQQQQSGAAVSTFVNPATDAGQSRAKDAYLWQVVRKFSQYLPDLREKNEGGTVVLRFVIARDGRLVEASIVKSSGVTALDRGMLESLRAAAPYPPMPSEIPGNQVTFIQPIAAAARR